MKTIWNGIKNENPTFVLLLGLCPALAVTTKVENAYMMGLCVLVILLFSNLLISLLKKIIPENVQIPAYILIIATFVTILEMILNKLVPDLYQALGIYLSLVVVNCIVLGRALSIASKESVGKSVLDAIGIGFGFTISLIVIALFREVLGNNTLTIMDSLSAVTGYRAVYHILPNGTIFPIKILVEPAGAFLTLGILLAILNGIRGGKNESN